MLHLILFLGLLLLNLPEFTVNSVEKLMIRCKKSELDPEPQTSLSNGRVSVTQIELSLAGPLC